MQETGTRTGRGDYSFHANYQEVVSGKGDKNVPASVTMLELLVTA